MTENDLLLASFHPLAQQLYFERIRVFQSQSGLLDRGRSEQRYQALCNQHLHTLRSELEAQALRLLGQHGGAPGAATLDRGLREIIQEYVRQFVRRIS